MYSVHLREVPTPWAPAYLTLGACLRGRVRDVSFFFFYWPGYRRTLENRVFLPRTLRGRWNFASVSRIALFPIRENPVRILLYSTRSGRISRGERNTAEWNVTVNIFNRADDIRRLIFYLMRFERRRDPGVGNINDSLDYCSNFIRSSFPVVFVYVYYECLRVFTMRIRFRIFHSVIRESNY